MTYAKNDLSHEPDANQDFASKEKAQRANAGLDRFVLQNAATPLSTVFSTVRTDRRQTD